MWGLLDLVLPLECGGCDRPGARWCADCARQLDDAPVRLRPRVDPGVPCWALGDYSGARRRAVVAAKERGRRDLAMPLGAGLATAIVRLRHWGELDPPQLAPLALVPAPTRAAAARVRGGDPVTRMAAEAAALLGCSVVPMLTMRRGVRDSVGLSAAQRRANLAGRVTIASRSGTPVSNANVLLVDDVLTTGATAAESVRALGDSGVSVTAMLVVAAV